MNYPSVKYNTWIIHKILREYLKESNVGIEMPSFRISLKRENFSVDLFDYLF